MPYLEFALTLSAGLLIWSRLGTLVGVSLPGSAVILRILWDRPRWPRSVVSNFVLLFLCTAAMGVWASYNRSDALETLAGLLVAAWLFVLIVSDRQLGFWRIASMLGSCTLLYFGYFVATYDWSMPVDLHLIARVAETLQRFRPEWGWRAPHPNAVAGLLAMAVPPSLALTLRQRQLGQPMHVLLPAALTFLLLLALFLTSSRGAWIALGAALLVWSLWRSCLVASRRLGFSSLALFVLAAAAGLTALIVFGPSLASVAHWLPGPDSVPSRQRLIVESLTLVRDFPFTGGGLASFAGLYSEYVLASPYLRFDYAHNLYLDVALGQGLLGLVALLGTFSSAALLLGRCDGDDATTDHHDLAREATAAAMCVVLLHGLIDDPLYSPFTPTFLFVLPALSLRLYRPDKPPVHRSLEWRSLLAVSAVAALMAVFVVHRSPSLLAQWHANLGAVAMARHDLDGWPRNEWKVEPEIEGLRYAQLHFEAALTRDSRNATALHRLGIIAAAIGDYQKAEDLLSQAYRVTPDSRGITKRLGYAQVWQGDLIQAECLLSAIPEAAAEMDDYVSWWDQLGAPELAERAAAMARRLGR